MAELDDQILVRSHVARDLLQTAGLFRNERLVVWEYVANGLEYVDPGTSPVVKVTLDGRRKRVTIADNGRGMDWLGLKNFFVMHGENLDRKAGRAGRGRFGTGKSAAFGIADRLRITTVRNRKRSQVELSRAGILAMSSGEEIPVRVLEREVATPERTGTVVEIEAINLRSIDQAGIIRYIERHLARWPKDVAVFVNNHECEVAEPPVAWEQRIRPEGDPRSKLGDVELVLKVSKAALEEDFRGVSIYSKGVWHETTLAGSEGKEMAQYIFGEIDVPKLDEDDSPISPFNVSRSMELNPSNELVQVLYAFINQNVEQVRRELADAERRRKASEEAKKLAEQAEEIARVINEDFEEYRNRVAKAKAKASGGSDLYRPEPVAGPENDLLLPGSDVPADIVSPIGSPGSQGGPGGNGTEPRMLMPEVAPALSTAERKGRVAGGTGNRAKTRGGFQVRFDQMGEESHRAKYVSVERTIYINLDHPQVVAARGSLPVDDPNFRRLAYEIAFTEYAIALAMELAQLDGYYIDPTDPIFDIGDTLNRLARKGAKLYSARS